jgi:hypothetical protein
MNSNTTKMMMITMYQGNMLFSVLSGEMGNFITIYKEKCSRVPVEVLWLPSQNSEDDLPVFFDYEGTQPIEPVAKPVRARRTGRSVIC